MGCICAVYSYLLNIFNEAHWWIIARLYCSSDDADNIFPQFYIWATIRFDGSIYLFDGSEGFPHAYKNKKEDERI